MGILSIDTAKQFLQVAHSAEDDVIQILLDSAEELVCRETGIYLHAGSGAVEELLDGGCQALLPTKLPILSVTGVYDTWSDDEAVDDLLFSEVRVMRKYAYQWFAVGVKRWKVKYAAGYAATTVPAGLKQIFLDLVYRGYTNRGSKGHQSAAGHGYDWQALADSDLMHRLRKYSYRVRTIG